MPCEIVPAHTPTAIAQVRRLFEEYVASLGVDLAHQGVAAEFAGLPGAYAPPSGTLLLAERDGPVGCVALRPLATPGACEIKRLYVRPAARGTGAGRALLAAALRFAGSAGYERVLLDTLPTMAGALALYRALGFAPVPPYWDNPLPGTLYFGKELRRG